MENANTTATELTQIQFVVPNSRLGWLKEKIAGYTKRANKLGVAAPRLVTVCSYDASLLKRVDKKMVFTGEIGRWWDVVVTGEAPKLNGWILKAVLQNMGDEAIIRNVPGQEIPAKYRTSDPNVCEHCNTSRNRIDSFVVGHDDGRHMQIGRQCLKDFLGHKSPAQLAGWAEMWDEISALLNGPTDEGSGNDGGYGRATALIDLTKFLSFVSASTNVHRYPRNVVNVSSQRTAHG